jgi:hypothetical protein
VTSENLVRDIRRATRKHHAAEEKIWPAPGLNDMWLG